MDSVLPIELKEHVTTEQIEQIENNGIEVSKFKKDKFCFQFFARCRSERDEKTVKAINEATPLLDDYYYTECPGEYLK